MKKINVFHLLLRVLFVLTLVLSLLPYKGSSNTTGTLVSGTISENTIWTKTGSPYILTDILTINPNITLTIEPGVEVISGSGKWMEVKGKLKAIGTPEERIIFKDAYINGWDWVNQSIHLEYTNLYHESYNGNFLVTSSRKDITLRHNRFSNGLVNIAYPNSNTYVESNLFTKGATLNINNSSGRVIVRNNTFNNEGISQADITIISRDPYGKLPNVEINENNFFGQNRLSVNLDGYDPIIFNGLNNYWGTTSPQLINNRILDLNNQLNIETIAYKPFNNGYEFGNLDAPTLLPVGDTESVVRGLTDGDSVISVYNGSQLIGQGKSTSIGDFNISIPLQSSGSQLRVSVIDSFNRKSTDETVTVLDVTPPITPQVNEISNLSKIVTGKAESGSSVIVKKGLDTIGTGEAKTDGTFEISIEKLAAGSLLNIFSSDSSGNKSSTIFMTVKDRIPPIKPVLISPDLTDNSSVITGTGEVGSNIIIKREGIIIGSGIVDLDGIFNIPIEIQKAGTILEIIAKDYDGNVSESVLIPVRDVTPPIIKYIGQINDQSTNINGITEPGSVISVKSNGIEIASTVTSSDGTFLVSMGPYTAGTILEVTAKDASGNISKSNRIFIEKKNTNSFEDLSSTHRFYNEINYLLIRGIITGFPDGSFRPNDKVTRAQAAIMIGRALGINGDKGETDFKDVGTSSSASGFIKAAVEMGIIKGFPDNTYRPNEPVTRGQMAIFIARAFDLKDEVDVSFKDVHEKSASYIYIKRILANRITTGYLDGTFKPEKDLIRSDFSSFMARALDDNFKK